MAGTKGRSGGARPGAGRKKKAAPEVQNLAPEPLEERDMLQLLQDIALGRVKADNIQVRAAIAAVQYTHPKKCESSGKKEAQDEATKAASAGKFGRREAPKLAAAGGKRVD